MTRVADQFSRHIGPLTEPEVPFEEAVTEVWDAVFFAAHGNAHLFPRSRLKIHIQHGLGAGKNALESNYTYGPLWVMRDNRVIYDIFLESSEQEARRVARTFPHVADRLEAVGSFIADEILAQAKKRIQCRAALGIPECDQRAILFMSTWGENAVLKHITTDQSFLKECQPGDHLLFTVHPHMLAILDVDRCFHAFRKAHPHLNIHYTVNPQDVGAYLVAADVAISDFTSLSLYYCLLGKPLYSSGLHLDSTADPSGLIYQLMNRIPRALTVESCFDPACQTKSLTEVNSIAKHILSYPGESAERFIVVLNDALATRRSAL